MKIISATTMARTASRETTRSRLAGARGEAIAVSDIGSLSWIDRLLKNDEWYHTRMSETPNARRRLLRRVAIVLLVLAAVVFTIALSLTLLIPTRVASAPPVAAKVAIVVSPHPDDETYAMGQTIATQDLSGIRTIGVLVTDGESSRFVDVWAKDGGSDKDGDGDIDRWDFGLARREEYRAAMKVLGVDEVVFLGASDTQGTKGIGDTKVQAAELQTALSALAEKNPGATWFTVAPYESERFYSGDYKNHPDHGQVAAAVASVARERGEKAYWFKVYAYYLYPFARFAPERVEGTPEALARKRAAIEEFSAIGGMSTPELFKATSKDEAEYLVPALD